MYKYNEEIQIPETLNRHTVLRGLEALGIPVVRATEIRFGVDGVHIRKFKVDSEGKGKVLRHIDGEKPCEYISFAETEEVYVPYARNCNALECACATE